MIALIDFGAGNLKSAWHAISALTSKVDIVVSPAELPSGTRGLVLPGDGSFRSAIERLEETGFARYLREENRLPLLGICVGFQLLFRHSDEDGGADGLGLIDGQVVRFPSGPEKVPHMGCNPTRQVKASPLLEGVPENSFFYYVHSYHAVVPSHSRGAVLLETEYIHPFVSGVEQGTVCGFQFHPEKSHHAGHRILANWVKGLS